MTVDLTGQYDRPLDCFCDDDAGALSLHAVRPDSLEAWFDSLEPGQSRFLKALGFGASANSLALVPGPEGIALAVAGLGSKTGPLAYGAIPGLLPAGTVWRLVGAGANCADAVLGFGLGAYRFDQLKTAAKAPFARLVLPEGPDVGAAVAAVRAAWLVRDLVNLPANMLGPAALALVAERRPRPAKTRQLRGVSHRCDNRAAIEESLPGCIFGIERIGSGWGGCEHALAWIGVG